MLPSPYSPECGVLRDAPLPAAVLQVPSDFGGRAGPGVLPNPYGPGLLMFYTAIAEEEVGVYGKWSIGCATSEDGVSWTRVGEKPVIEGGASCSQAAVLCAAVCKYCRAVCSRLAASHTDLSLFAWEYHLTAWSHLEQTWG